MNRLIFFALALLMILGACSRSREVRIDALSDDIGTRNVVVTFADGDTYRSETVSAIDGTFSLTLMMSTPDPTVVEVTTTEGAPLGMFIVRGGDHIKVRLSVRDPRAIEVEGNRDAEHLAEFLKEQGELIDSGDVAALNKVIDSYISEHPDEFLSTVLLTHFYCVPGYEERAMELLRLIPEKYAPRGFAFPFMQQLDLSQAADSLAIEEVKGYSRGDSAYIWRPAGARLNLLMLTDDSSRMADSIRTLASLLDNPADASRLRITDFGIDRDTILWNASMRNLPEDYPSPVMRLWLPAGSATVPLTEVRPSAIPYFILTDSLGNMLARSPSTTAIRSAYGLHRNL